MINKNSVLFILVLMAGAAGLSAAETLVLTEEAAVALALEQNYDLQSSRLDLEGSRETEKNSWNVFLPDLSALTGVSRSEELFSDAGNLSDDWSVYGGLSASLNLSYAAVQGIESNKLALESRELLYETSEDSLIVSVKKQFYYLLANKENLELEKKNLELAEKRYEQARVNYENGLSSELDVMEARNSYESMRPSYTNTRTSYETRVMAFKTLLGLDLEQDVVIDGSLDVEVRDLDASALIDGFMMNRLDIQTAVKDVEMERLTESVTGIGNRTPTLSLSGEWRNSASDIVDPDWYDTATISLALTMPLNGFIPGSSETLSMRNARREVEKAELDLKDTMLNAEEDIRTTLMNLEGDLENIEITGLSVELAEKTYEMTDYAYRQGTREILDVEDAQNKLLEAQQDLIASRYSYLSGLLDLELALNTDRESILSVGSGE